MGFTREQYLQSAQKALMFFAINVALITYHKLNKGAADGDAVAFEASHLTPDEEIRLLAE